jgi:PAS domain S-box-containing protein
MRYEAALTDTLVQTGCLALCLYDRRVCPAEILLSAIRAHPLVISGHRLCENFYCVSPEQARAAQRTSLEVERRLHNLRDRDKTLHELEVFRALVDGSNNAIEIVDPETNRILDVNGQCCRDLGYTREELLRLTIFDIDPQIPKESVAARTRELARGGSIIFESTRRKKNGSTFPVEVNLRMVTLDRPYCVSVTCDLTDRKKLEAALREREDHYRDLVEHSCDLICTHDLDGNLLSVNDVPCRILGYTREEILRTPMRKIVPPELVHEVDEYMARIQRDGSAQGLLAVMTKSGERRIWEYHNTLRIEGVTRPIVRGIAHDVTDKKRVEKALRVSEEKFSKAFRSSPVAMAIMTRADGRFIDVNDACERLTGYSLAESIGKTCNELGLKLSSAETAAAMAQELQSTQRIKNAEVEWCNKSGEVRVTLYSAEPIEIGGRECMLATCEDITYRKEAERKLRLSEEKFSKAFRCSPDIISINSLKKGRFIEVNEAFERQSGYSREEVIGRTDVELHIWPDLVDRDLLGDYICKDGRIRDQELRLRTKSGQLRNVIVSIEIIELEGESCALCVGQDVTALKEAENQLRGMSGRIIALQEEERRRIARDLHDSTAQQLTGLRMGLGVIKRSAKKLDRKALQALAECLELAELCAREVRTISYLLHPPLLDEFGLVLALRSYIQGVSKRSGLRVKLDADELLERAKLPHDLETNVFRIVQEGLTNIKSHSGSSTATISLKRKEPGIILEIRDRGRGFAPPVAAAIAKGDFSSLGVGLSGMRERVRQLGGHLQLETGDAGTTILVALPVDIASASATKLRSLAASGTR